MHNLLKMKPKSRVRITRENLDNWPSFQKRYNDGEIRFDSKGRLRYSHGAPVGDMLLERANQDGKAIYKESAEEWFDPDSPMAESFVWP